MRETLAALCLAVLFALCGLLAADLAAGDPRPTEPCRSCRLCRSDRVHAIRAGAWGR